MNQTTGNFVLATLILGCIHQAHILKTNISEELTEQRREQVLEQMIGSRDDSQNFEKPFVFENTTKETI